MRGVNLSEWALKNQSLTRYLIVVLLLAGVWAYGKLGQKEDPEFTFKAMLVQVQWPGATAEEVEAQVTDRIEKKLQDMPELEYGKSFSKPGEAQFILSTHEHLRGRDVADTWYQVRKKLGDLKATGGLPATIKGPFFNDEFGDTFGNIYAFTADGFSYEELRQYVDHARQQATRIPDVAKVEIIGEQAEKVYVSLDTAKIASLGLDLSGIWNAVAAQNAVEAAGIYHTPGERFFVRVEGA